MYKHCPLFVLQVRYIRGLYAIRWNKPLALELLTAASQCGANLDCEVRVMQLKMLLKLEKYPVDSLFAILPKYTKVISLRIYLLLNMGYYMYCQYGNITLSLLFWVTAHINDPENYFLRVSLFQ